MEKKTLWGFMRLHPSLKMSVVFYIIDLISSSDVSQEVTQRPTAVAADTDMAVFSATLICPLIAFGPEVRGGPLQKHHRAVGVTAEKSNRHNIGP